MLRSQHFGSELPLLVGRGSYGLKPRIDFARENFEHLRVLLSHETNAVLARANRYPGILDREQVVPISCGDADGLSALLGAASPDLALASDASDSLPLPDHDGAKINWIDFSAIHTFAVAKPNFATVHSEGIASSSAFPRQTYVPTNYIGDPKIIDVRMHTDSGNVHARMQKSCSNHNCTSQKGSDHYALWAKSATEEIRHGFKVIDLFVRGFLNRESFSANVFIGGALTKLLYALGFGRMR
ncbi:hypothetical protein EVAR_68709_1 [Eumeta japonica]|uniref:Uncharacterized protein n=1 Tax=Eumeta variegata TaxID=151549 RepID=A0A4C2A137_EUMVA|nr:hypothetical protein EVAR_68709_1 [Eumeta japonica]